MRDFRKLDVWNDARKSLNNTKSSNFAEKNIIINKIQQNKTLTHH